MNQPLHPRSACVAAALLCMAAAATAGPIVNGTYEIHGNGDAFLDAQLLSGTVLNLGFTTGSILSSLNGTPLTLSGLTQLTGNVTFNGGSFTDGVALTTSNLGSFVQSGSGQLVLQWDSSFINTTGASYQIANDLGISHDQDQGIDFQHIVVNAAGASFVKTGGIGNSLIDVPLNNAGLVAANTGTIVLAGGGTHDGGVFQALYHAGTNGGSIALQGQHQIAGTGSTAFDGYVSINTGAVTVSDTATLQLRDTSFNATGGGLSVYGGSALNIAGAATVEATGTLLINPGATLLLQGGGHLNVQGTVYNQGTFGDQSASNHVTVASGGVLWNGVGGSIVLNGMLQMSGTLQNDAAGSVSLLGPTHLDGQTVNATGATLTLAGATTSAAGSSIVNRGQLTHSGIWQLDGSLDNSGALDIHGSSASATSSGVVSNSGTVNIHAGAGLVVGSFTQTDGTLTVDGTLDSGVGITTQLLGGVLNGNGTINGDVFIGGGPSTASFKPGHSPGSFTVNGALTLGANSELELQVERASDGTLAWDHVGAISISFLAGSQVHFIVGNGVAGTSALSLDFLNCGSGCSFDTGVGFIVDGAPGATVSFSANGLELLIAPAQAVPEPSPALLLLAGLLAGAAIVRRRHGTLTPEERQR